MKKVRNSRQDAKIFATSNSAAEFSYSRMKSTEPAPKKSKSHIEKSAPAMGHTQATAACDSSILCSQTPFSRANTGVDPEIPDLQVTLSRTKHIESTDCNVQTSSKTKSHTVKLAAAVGQAQATSACDSPIFCSPFSRANTGVNPEVPDLKVTLGHTKHIESTKYNVQTSSKTKNHTVKEEEPWEYQGQIIPKLESVSHTSSAEMNELDETLCGICTKTISVFAAINSCCHTFCFNCIFGWAKRKTQCPVCGADFSHILFDEAPEKKVGSYYVESCNFNQEQLPVYKLLKSYLFRLIIHNYVRPNNYLRSFIVTMFNHVLDLTGWFARWTAIKNGAPLPHNDCIEEVLCRDMCVSKFVSRCEHKACYHSDVNKSNMGQLIDALLASKNNLFPNLVNNEGRSYVSKDFTGGLSDSDDSFDAELEKSFKVNTRMLCLRNRTIITYQDDKKCNSSNCRPSGNNLKNKTFSVT